MAYLKQINTSWQIGSLTLANRLIQAPLAGISCSAFRALFSFYIKPAYAVTEMIAANTILQQQKVHKRYLTRSKNEGLWCIQLSGSDPDTMYAATKVCESYQPDLIDLNCGCPKPKIRRQGSGSALIDSPKKLEAIVYAMRRATSLPLTVKIRLALGEDDSNYLELIKIIEGSGADAIIVHGRSYLDNYDTAANYEQISKVVDAVNIPVIANGDICDYLTMERCFSETSASGFMIARGSIGRPWIFQQLLEKEVYPSFVEIFSLFKCHIDELVLLEENELSALLQARKLLKWYFPSLTKEQLANCYQIDGLEDLYSVIEEYLHSVV